MTALGPEALFLVTASSHALIAGYAFYRTYRRAPIPESVREAFQTVPALARHDAGDRRARSARRGRQTDASIADACPPR